MEIGKREIVLLVIMGGLFTLCCFSFFQFVLPYHLFMKEQTQLFLLTTDYFIAYLHKPAWLGCYLGDFFTQFFYFRGGGATVLSLLLLLEWFLFIRVLKKIGLGQKSIWLALIPVLLECILHTQLTYSLSSTFSVILVLNLFLLYTCFDKKWLSCFAGLLFVPLLYGLAGALCFLFPVLVISYEIKKQKWHWLYWLLLCGVGLIFPSIVRHPYLLTNRQAYVYPAINLRIKGLNLKREKIFALASEAYFGKWDRVIELSDAYKLSNPTATYYTNIALSERHKLPDRLLDYYQPASAGLFIPVRPESGWQDIFFSSDVFFHIGDMNMAQHAAMLGMIFSPFRRSSRMVKRMAEVHLVLGDSVAAHKYLHMLKATLFHRRWAGDRLAMMQDNTPTNDWLASKRSQIGQQDVLRSASDYETALNVLIESNPENSYAIHYLLCYSLLNKDLVSFRKIFDTYCKGKREYLHRLYGEALLIGLLKEKSSQKLMESYLIPDMVVADFMKYTTLFDQREGDADSLREQYGKSYWFYYHFAQITEKQ